MIPSSSHRLQPFAVETAGATEIEAAPVVLGGSGGAASSIPFGFIPALDYVPRATHGSDSNREDKAWAKKAFPSAEIEFPGQA